MKWSLYNELIDDKDPDFLYLYNCFRGRYFTIDRQLQNLLKESLDNPQRLEDIHPTLYSALVNCHFLVSEGEDEIEECLDYLETRFNSCESLRITINPTLDCNLRCWYCYENRVEKSSMKASVLSGLFLYIKQKSEIESVKKINLSFFGGEPLLKYQSVVKPIVEYAKGVCLENDKSLMFSFTTNGVCLRSNVVDELRLISDEVSVQVAFDGNKELHDEVKGFPNGKGSYDIVKDNLFYAIKQGLFTTVRCNYTDKNILSFCELIDDFKDYWDYKNLRFAFHKVWQEEETDTLLEKVRILREKVFVSGIQSNVDSYYGDGIVNCYADYNNNIVINYDGNVFRCTARDFNPVNSIGKLTNEGKILYKQGMCRTVRERITEQCRECRMLPICTFCFQRRNESGSCPDIRRHDNASVNIRKYFYDINKRGNRL